MTSWRVRAASVPLLLAGRAPGAVASAQPSAGAPVSIQEIMDKVIDPSADALWEVGGVVVTRGKTQDRRPRTDQDWRKARALAVALRDGASNLTVRRPVGGNGHWALADAGTPGTRTAVQIKADIDRDPARFYAAAERLQRTAQDAVTAIDRRNLAALLEAGADIDAACEACHAAYWYPRGKPLALPTSAAFAASPYRP